MFATSQEAKKNGWHSRRNRDARAHGIARDAYMGIALAQKQGAEKRTIAAAARSPKEQIGRLDKRLGEGVGAKKERTRLAPKLGLLMCGHHYDPATHPYLATGCLVREDEELRDEREAEEDDFPLDRLDD